MLECVFRGANCKTTHTLYYLNIEQNGTWDDDLPRKKPTIQQESPREAKSTENEANEDLRVLA